MKTCTKIIKLDCQGNKEFLKSKIKIKVMFSSIFLLTSLLNDFSTLSLQI